MSTEASQQLRSVARFPSVPRDAGHYESFYLKACRPEGGLGIWIRYTVHKRPGGEPKGFLWFALFDSHHGVQASKVAGPSPTTADDCYLQIGDARFEPGRVIGQAATEQLDASWELEFEPGEEPLLHLPRAWMYRARIPRTKALTPHPATRFRGRIGAGARIIDVDGWPGMVGHNWGAEHAKRGMWLHGAQLSGRGDAWLDVVVGKLKLGPVTTPWIANGALSLEGRRYQLGGLDRVRRTVIDETPEHSRFVLPGHQITVEGSVEAPREKFVGWIYTQPSGIQRQTVNCSIADLQLTIRRPGAEPLTLASSGGAAYELQMDERYEAIPLQPFSDG